MRCRGGYFSAGIPAAFRRPNSMSATTTSAARPFVATITVIDTAELPVAAWIHPKAKGLKKPAALPSE